jgi:hypothetical protein
VHVIGWAARRAAIAASCSTKSRAPGLTSIARTRTARSTRTSPATARTTGTLEDIITLPNAKKLYPSSVELWAEALIEKRDNKWSDDNPIWRREYRAEWAADNTLRVFGAFRAAPRDGKPWNVWDPFDGQGLIEGVAGLRIAIAKLKKLHPEFTDWRFVVTKDQGHKDPFACNPFAFSPHDPLRRKWQVMSFERMGMGYGKPIAELLIGEQEVDTFVKTDVFPTKYGGVFGALGGWPDGMIMDTDNALLEDLKNVYGIKTEKADKKPDYKKGAIELVNGEFTDGRIIVLEGQPDAGAARAAAVEGAGQRHADRGPGAGEPLDRHRGVRMPADRDDVRVRPGCAGFEAAARQTLSGSNGTCTRDRHRGPGEAKKKRCSRRRSGPRMTTTGDDGERPRRDVGGDRDEGEGAP